MSTAAVTSVPKRNSLPRALRLELTSVYAAAIVTFALMLLARHPDDPDIWWHLRNVQLQLAAHGFLRADQYAFTTLGAPWIDYEWLAEVPFYAAVRLGGAHGLFVVTALLLAGIFLGLFRLAIPKAGMDARAAFLATGVAAVLATVSFAPRTLLFGWLALVIELLLLRSFSQEDDAAKQGLLWKLPLLFLLWANAHGSWLIGLAVLFLFVACGWRSFHQGWLDNRAWSAREKQILVKSSLAATAALFINPYGWRVVTYPFDLAFKQRLNVSHVQEWASLDFHAFRGHLLLAALVFLFLAQVCRGRRWTLFELTTLALGVYSAFTYSRFLFLAAILIAPLLARAIADLSRSHSKRERPLLNLLCMTSLLALTIWHAWPRAKDSKAEALRYPLEATPFLERWHPEGPVLNDYLWGGYLEWHAPQIPTFIDSRVDIFERKGVLADYLHITALEDSLALLDRYRIQYVFFHKDAPLIYLLLHTPGWKVDYEDKTAILLERTRRL